jgi:hypothetical protein
MTDDPIKLTEIERQGLLKLQALWKRQDNERLKRLVFQVSLDGITWHDCKWPPNRLHPFKRIKP